MLMRRSMRSFVQSSTTGSDISIRSRSGFSLLAYSLLGSHSAQNIAEFRTACGNGCNPAPRPGVTSPSGASSPGGGEGSVPPQEAVTRGQTCKREREKVFSHTREAATRPTHDSRPTWSPTRNDRTYSTLRYSTAAGIRAVSPGPLCTRRDR